MEQKSKNTFYLDTDYTNFVPRKTRFKYSTVGGGTSCFGLLAIFYGFVFFILLSHATTIAREYWQFSIKGTETRATITTCEDNADSNYPRITYTYTVADEVYNAEYAVVRHYSSCGQFKAGTQINIQYQLANPTHSRMILPNTDNFWANLNPSSLAFFACLIPFSLVGATFGILGIISDIKARYQYHLLRQEGIVLDGEVIKAEYEYQEPQGRYGGYYTLNVTVEFETPDERLLTRTFSKASQNKLFREIPQPGTPVKLLYANDHAVIML